MAAAGDAALARVSTGRDRRGGAGDGVSTSGCSIVSTMNRIEFPFWAVVQATSDGLLLGEALGFPEASRLAVDLTRLRRALERNVRRIVETAPAASLLRRQVGGEPAASGVDLALEPPTGSVLWREPLGLHFPVLRWSHGTDAEIAFVPALGIEVLAAKPEELDERLPREIRAPCCAFATRIVQSHRPHRAVRAPRRGRGAAHRRTTFAETGGARRDQASGRDADGRRRGAGAAGAARRPASGTSRRARAAGADGRSDEPLRGSFRPQTSGRWPCSAKTRTGCETWPRPTSRRRGGGRTRRFRRSPTFCRPAPRRRRRKRRRWRLPIARPNQGGCSGARTC